MEKSRKIIEVKKDEKDQNLVITLSTDNTIFRHQVKTKKHQSKLLAAHDDQDSGLEVIEKR